MARQQAPSFTEAELRLMEVIWARGEATVHDILKDLPEGNRPAYNTVLTIVRIMEQKGYLAHEKNGRAYIYRPLVKRVEASRKAVSQVVKDFFDNSPRHLLLNLIKAENLNSEDIRKLMMMIDESE